jgi:hypothetical protein
MFQNSPAPLRRVCMIRGIGLIAVACAIGFVTLVGTVDTQGMIIGFVLAGLCVLGAAYNLWRTRRTPKDATVKVMITIEDLPPSRQLTFARRALWASLIAFPVLSGYIGYELYRLESHEVKSVMIWAPISFLYEYLGFWPAELAVPLLGIICIATYLGKLKQLRSAPPADAPPPPASSDQG